MRCFKSLWRYVRWSAINFVSTGRDARFSFWLDERSRGAEHISKV